MVNFIPLKRGGCGILFYNEKRDSVLVFLRDNKSDIPYPGILDILGGKNESSETALEAICREIAEEIHWKENGAPLHVIGLTDMQIFREYFEVNRHSVQTIFWAKAPFEIEEVDLLEGQKLVWLGRHETETTSMAFGFEEVVKDFFFQMH